METQQPEPDSPAARVPDRSRREALGQIHKHAERLVRELLLQKCRKGIFHVIVKNVDDRFAVFL